MSEGVPLISFITPVLNRAGMIQQAIESLLANDGATFEHIVVDGGSTDGTLEIVRRYSSVRLIEAPGSDIYSALNMGIRAARGEIIGHLNSDDLIPAGALSALAQAFAAAPEVDSVRGHARFIRCNERGKFLPDGDSDRTYPKQLTARDAIDGHLSINAIYTRRKAYMRVGLYDARFRYAADREWMLRAMCRDLRVRQIPACTYVYRRHRGSLTLNPEGSASQLLRSEALAIAALFVQSRDVPAVVRSACLRSHAKNSAVLAAGILRNGQGLAALRSVVGSAIAADRWWILRCLAYLPRIVGDRLSRAVLGRLAFPKHAAAVDDPLRNLVT